MVNSPGSSFKTILGTLTVDDLKIRFDKSFGIFGGSSEIIYFDKIEYIYYKKEMHIPLLIGAAFFFVIGFVLQLINIEALPLFGIYFVIVSIVLLGIVFYMRKESIIISAAKNSITLSYNQEIFEELLRRKQNN